MASKGTLVKLTGDVRIRRQAYDHHRGVTVLTEALTVRPKERYAETDRPATVLSEGARVNSIGLRAWLPQSRLELLARVRGKYETPTR